MSVAQQKAQDEVSKKVQLAFADMDKDGNGVVTFREFKDYCARTVGLKGFVEAFQEIDTSGDQQITVDELQALCRKVRPEKIQECHITDLFYQLDKSGDGKLDKQEFRELMKRCGHNESVIQKTFDYIAGDDGEITLQEFLTAFRKS